MYCSSSSKEFTFLEALINSEYLQYVWRLCKDITAVTEELTGNIGQLTEVNTEVALEQSCQFCLILCGAYTFVVDVAGIGESSIAVLSKSDISDAPFEVVATDSGQTLQTQTSDSQPPSTLPVSWYQSTSAATSLGAPAGTQVRPQRPLQEIVSSMQGNYNFLQDSEIEGECFSVCSFSFAFLAYVCVVLVLLAAHSVPYILFVLH